jgi:methylthioribose-1-phosphate isomerase
MIEPVRFEDNTVVLLDQRLLPREETWVRCADVPSVIEAIRSMVVRGAPAIGVTGAGGLAVAASRAADGSVAEFHAAIDEAADALVAARPTAVNLAWGVRRVRAAIETAIENGGTPAHAADCAWCEAEALRAADVEANRALGRHGSMLVPDGARVLTHCNAGALATAGYGTALGVIRAAVEDGKKVAVLADETRPFLQGARLTAWELQRDGIPVTVITDSMAGALMARGEVDLVVVGADRIARNGDVANKIGTYTVAVLARRHGIPFYVAAPVSTLDPDCPDGSAIPIEERAAVEVTHVCGQRMTPEGIDVRNPAFDVTPAELVTAIVTEEGVHRPPYSRSLGQALGIPEESPDDTGSPLAGEADLGQPVDAGTDEVEAPDDDESDAR